MNINTIGGTTPYQPQSSTTPQNVRPAPVRSEDSRDAGELTQAETEFFEKLYPDAAGDIRTHVTYGRNGTSTPSILGTLIDRKG